jgi:folate-binding protein YgfZ
LNPKLNSNFICSFTSKALSVLPPLGDIYEEDIDSKQTLYDYLRNLSGVAEGPSQIVPLSSIPFECNFDLTNGIDYDKGCYIGQELVARTHFRGAVRKRLFPLVSLGTAQSLAGRTKSTASQLLSSIWNNDLQTNEITAVPQGILRPIPGVAAQTSAASSQSKLGPASSSGASKKVRVNVELDPTYDIANHFPPEGTALIPITNETDLESILSGKTLAFKGGAASMSRVSKTIGGSSWNAGMGMLRVDALESSPAMLFYAPSTSDTSTGSLLKVVKPWWYSNYQHWRLEAESKAEAQQAEDL